MTEHVAIGNEDLIAFYRARLAEDEATAKAQAALDEAQGNFSSAGASFGARFNPARVLRDVEVGRALLAAYEEAHTGISRKLTEPGLSGLPAIAEFNGVLMSAPERIEEIFEQSGAEVLVYVTLGQEVARRAAVWSDHPDHRPEWPDYDDPEE